MSSKDGESFTHYLSDTMIFSVLSECFSLAITPICKPRLCLYYRQLRVQRRKRCRIPGLLFAPTTTAATPPRLERKVVLDLDSPPTRRLWRLMLDRWSGTRPTRSLWLFLWLLVPAQLPLWPLLLPCNGVPSSRPLLEVCEWPLYTSCTCVWQRTHFSYEKDTCKKPHVWNCNIRMWITCGITCGCSNFTSEPHVVI